MAFKTNRSYIDFDVHLVGTDTYDTTTTPSNEVKIKASDPAASDVFGRSIAVGSGRIVVGAYFDDEPNNSGSAYIFNLNGTQLAKIKASDPVSLDLFGWSVAVGSGRIVVGAYGVDDLGTASGAAYIFNLNGTQLAKIKASDGGANDNFGKSVAVGCGRIVVGSDSDDDIAVNSGAAYIFDLYGNQLAKIKASDASSLDNFGAHVAVGCGRIVVSAAGDTDPIDPLLRFGSAYVFDLNGNQIAKIVASDPADDDEFGTAVAVGSGRIVVGAQFDDDLGSNSGSAYIFDLNGNQIAKIKAADGAASDFFGTSVDVGSGRIVVGASGTGDELLDGDPTDSGSAYVFNLNGTQLAKIKASDREASDFFGDSVAVGSGRIVVGSSDDTPTDSGAAYIYTTPNQPHILDILDDK